MAERDAKRPKPSVSSDFDDIQRDRKNLPIYEAKEALLKEIFARNVSVVVGETGSGKTTQIPQYLVDDPRFKVKCCVCSS